MSAVGTDTSNPLTGRTRTSLPAAVVVAYPIAPVPASLTLGYKYDKAVALPTPDMVDGRPT